MFVTSPGPIHPRGLDIIFHIPGLMQGMGLWEPAAKGSLPHHSWEFGSAAGPAQALCVIIRSLESEVRE